MEFERAFNLKCADADAPPRLDVPGVLGHELEDPAAVRLGDGAESVFHASDCKHKLT